MNADIATKKGYRSWLPRLSSAVMVDLRIWMIAFGMLMGLVFPLLVVGLGVRDRTALRPTFFIATLIAGLIVAAINYVLAHQVIGVRLSQVADSMERVRQSLALATASGETSVCDPKSCSVPVDSSDELGAVANAFNHLVTSLATSQAVSAGVRRLLETMSAQLDLGVLSRSVIETLQDIANFDGAALLVTDHGELKVAAAHALAEVETLITAEPVLTALRTGRVTRTDLPNGVTITTGLVDFLPVEVQIVPVQYGALSVGVLVLAFSSPSTPETNSVLSASLPGLAIALTNAMNHQDLQRVAATDPLTGIYNRRFGLQRLKEEFARAKRSEEPLGVMLLDLDRFKVVNDTYGHLVGDRVLQAVARSVRSVVREGDIFMRYGGEEFLVVLPGAGFDDTRNMAERVRHAVADLVIQEGSHMLTTTISIGASGMPNNSVADSLDLVSLADEALYEAKRTGRNRWVIQ